MGQIFRNAAATAATKLFLENFILKPSLIPSTSSQVMPNTSSRANLNDSGSSKLKPPLDVNPDKTSSTDVPRTKQTGVP